MHRKRTDIWKKERMRYEQYNLLRVWKLEANSDLEILKWS